VSVPARAARHFAGALLTLAALAPAPALARELAIEAFDAEIMVRRNGEVVVTERIRARFTGAWNGIYRVIPVEYDGPGGLGYSLVLRLESATDEAGRPLRVEQSRKGRYRRFRIWVPGAVDATRTLVLRYTVPNGLRFFDTHDELYWNVTGDEWEAPIEAASARIVLPAQASGVRAVAYTGIFGARESAASVQVAGNGIMVRTLKPLGFREGLTIAVAWDPGVVARPTLLTRANLFFLGNWAFLIPIVMLFVSWRIWLRRGRDPQLRPIAAAYEPPDQLTPAELGTLIDGRPDVRDITATLVDLAVRGFLLIEETTREHLLGLFSTTDYAFTIRRPRAAWTELLPHERDLLRAVFATGDSVRLNDLENRFYKEIPTIRADLYERMVARGYYLHRPDRVAGVWAAIAIAVTAACGAAAFFFANRLGQSLLAPGIATALTGVITLGFAFVMPVRTLRCTRALEQVLGFQEFLGRVEADRIERTILTPALFERLLPFAMALGVEKKWAAAFDDIASEPPEWYRGRHGVHFRAGLFAHELSRLGSRTAAAMTARPRSSSRGSGFGGGGFSGGGFGGGGGGGF